MKLKALWIYFLFKTSKKLRYRVSIMTRGYGKVNAPITTSTKSHCCLGKKNGLNVKIEVKFTKQQQKSLNSK